MVGRVSLVAAELGLEVVALAPYALGLLLCWGGLTLLSNFMDPTIALVQMQLGDRLTREMQTRIIVKANNFADVSFFEPDASPLDSRRVYVWAAGAAQAALLVAIGVVPLLLPSWSSPACPPRSAKNRVPARATPAALPTSKIVLSTPVRTKSSRVGRHACRVGEHMNW